MTLRVQIWYTENIVKQHIPYFVEVSTRGKQLPYPIFCRSKQKGQATPSVTVFFLIFCISSLCDESVKRDLKDWDISEEVVLDRSAWRLAINVPKPWPVCLLGFISSLSQLVWDKRLCCCCGDCVGLVNEACWAQSSYLLALEISLTYLKFQVRYIEDSF